MSENRRRVTVARGGRDGGNRGNGPFNGPLWEGERKKRDRERKWSGRVRKEKKISWTCIEMRRKREREKNAELERERERERFKIEIKPYRAQRTNQRLGVHSSILQTQRCDAHRPRMRCGGYADWASSTSGRKSKRSRQANEEGKRD